MEAIRSKILKNINEHKIVDKNLLKKCKLIEEIIHFDLHNCRVAEKIKNEIKILEETIQVKGAENIEIDDNMKYLKETNEQIKTTESDIAEKTNCIQTKVMKAYNESEKQIDRFIEIEKKICAGPKSLEIEQQKGKILIEIENSKYESICNMIEDCKCMEENAFSKIRYIESEFDQENEKCKQCYECFEKKTQIAEDISMYEQERIPLKVNDISIMDENVTKIEVMVREKTKINDNIKKSIDELKMNLQNVQSTEEELDKKLQIIKGKRESLANNEISVLDESDEAIRDLISIEEYQSENEKLKKLKLDQVDIQKDVQKTKNYNDELQKELEALKLDEKNEEMLLLKKTIESLNKNISLKQLELGSLKEINMQQDKAIEAYKRQNEFLTSTLDKMKENLKVLAKKAASKQKTVPKKGKMKSKRKQKPSALKTKIKRLVGDIQQKQSNTQPENGKSSTASDARAASQAQSKSKKTKNKESEDSLNNSVYNNSYDLDIPDPDDIEANFNNTMSDNSSSYWIDTSFMNFDDVKKSNDE